MADVGITGGVVVTFDTRELDKIIAKSGLMAHEIMISLALDAEDHAKMLAPIDTGALRSSIYTNAAGHLGLRSAKAETLSLNPNVNWNPIMTPSEFSKDTVAVVGAAVDYAVYVELGTYKMRARPFLSTAVEIVAGKLNRGETWKEMFT